jgi:hypothetical protein
MSSFYSTMDMVLPRTALEATSDSMCSPGEAAVKNKILTIKNEVSFYSVVEN